MIPDASNYLVNKNDLNNSLVYEKMPKRFLELGINPFFIISYGRTLTTWVFIVFIALPILLVLRRTCKNVNLWEEVTSAFFFNGPLRAMAESYFDISFTVLLNSKCFYFRNWSEIVSSSLTIIIAGVAILMPFILMTLIYANRKKIKGYEW
jgi:hypothetical protein